MIYTVYSDNACSQNARTAGSVAVNESTGAVPNSNTLSFPTAGTFYWQASFSGDANNAATLSSCSSEPLTVGKASLTLTTAATPTAAAVGQTVQDDATLAGGSAPTGTVTFTLTNASSAVEATETATVSGNGAYDDTDGTGDRPGTYQWSGELWGRRNNSSAIDQGGSAEQGDHRPGEPDVDDDVEFDFDRGWRLGLRLRDADGGAARRERSTVTYTIYTTTPARRTTGRRAGRRERDHRDGAELDHAHLPDGGHLLLAGGVHGRRQQRRTPHSCTSEPLTVGKTSPTITTALSGDYDRGWRHGVRLGDAERVRPVAPRGTVTYTVYSNTACSQNDRAPAPCR